MVFIPCITAIHREYIPPNDRRAAVQSQGPDGNRRSLDCPVVPHRLFGGLIIGDIRFFLLRRTGLCRRLRRRGRFRFGRWNWGFLPWGSLLRGRRHFGGCLHHGGGLLYRLQFIIRDGDKTHLRAHTEQLIRLCCDLSGQCQRLQKGSDALRQLDDKALILIGDHRPAEKPVDRHIGGLQVINDQQKGFFPQQLGRVMNLYFHHTRQKSHGN